MFGISVRARRAFTLVELLVVIAIIGILVALLIPAVNSAREAARKTTCRNRMKQQALGMLTLGETMKCLPWQGAPWPNPGKKPPTPVGARVYHCSVFFALLPFIEERAYFDKLPFNAGSDYFNDTLRITMNLSTYVCPSDNSGIGPEGRGSKGYDHTGPGTYPFHLTSYNDNGEVFVNGAYPTLKKSFRDGTSKTVEFVEHLALCGDSSGVNSVNGLLQRSVWPAIHVGTGDSNVYWQGIEVSDYPPGLYRVLVPGPFGTTSTYEVRSRRFPQAKIPDPARGNKLSYRAPQDAPTLTAAGRCEPTTASSGHYDVVFASFVDGSVQGISPDISLGSWNALLTPAGGEISPGNF
jgi:prepilin-type N-terminal cleavage/methylation domain-containing protein